jgi:hypothetical protein
MTASGSTNQLKAAGQLHSCAHLCQSSSSMHGSQGMSSPWVPSATSCQPSHTNEHMLMLLPLLFVALPNPPPPHTHQVSVLGLDGAPIPPSDLRWSPPVITTTLAPAATAATAARRGAANRGTAVAPAGVPPGSRVASNVMVTGVNVGRPLPASPNEYTVRHTITSHHITSQYLCIVLCT